MSENFDQIRKRAGLLNVRQKAALAQALITELDEHVEDDVDDIWIREAQRRHRAYRSGEVGTIPEEGAMQRARERLR